MTSQERKENRYQRRKAKRLELKRKRTEKFDDFNKVFTYDHLYKSYLKCRKNVRWKSSTQKYISNAALNVYETYEELHNGTFKSDGFHEFDICERGKLRHIRSVSIKERIVQRCLCDYSLVPVLKRIFIHDNGASVKHKGYSFALKRIVRHINWHYKKYGNNGYILLFDFSSYFDSIPHDLIDKILKKEFTDERIIKLTQHFVSMFGNRGLGLGSQVSQILALAAANELDHYIKETLGIKCYGRYMDDGYLIHPDKDYLIYCLDKLQQKCTELGLTLNIKKTQIVALKKDFTWLKVRFRLTDSGYIVRRVWKKSVIRMRRKLKKLHKKWLNNELTINDISISFQSWVSHLKGLDVYKTLKGIKQLYNSLFNNCEVSI